MENCHKGELCLLAVSASILMLTLAVLLIRFGHIHYPYPGGETKE